LGIGPGYLAEFILNKKEKVTYKGMDFSISMLEIASKRLQSNRNKIVLTQADLTRPSWVKEMKTSPKSIVSTWALHDLLNKENIFNVYRSAFEILPQGGKLINGDFIKPEGTNFDYEIGRINPSEHIELLRKSGFNHCSCIGMFEEDVDRPTTSNNYACFKAVK